MNRKLKPGEFGYDNRNGYRDDGKGGKLTEAAYRKLMGDDLERVLKYQREQGKPPKELEKP